MSLSSHLQNIKAMVNGQAVQTSAQQLQAANQLAQLTSRSAIGNQALASPYSHHFPSFQTPTQVLEMISSLHARDSGVSVLYSKLPGVIASPEDLLPMGIHIGTEMAEMGGKISTCEVLPMMEGLLRWTFPDDNHATIFKLKFSSDIVPAPWREFYNLGSGK